MDVQILLLSHCFCFPPLPTSRWGDGGFCGFSQAPTASSPRGAVAVLRSAASGRCFSQSFNVAAESGAHQVVTPQSWGNSKAGAASPAGPRESCAAGDVLGDPPECVMSSGGCLKI